MSKLIKLKEEYEALSQELKKVSAQLEANPDDSELRLKEIALLEQCNKKLSEMIGLY
jgi:flagellar motor switch protein FliM